MTQFKGQIITHSPVHNPPIGLCTPLASFTADLEKDPEMGIAPKNDPTTLLAPNANISCVASILCPHEKAFEIATFCKTEINATITGPAPRRENDWITV